MKIELEHFIEKWLLKRGTQNHKKVIKYYSMCLRTPKTIHEEF